MLRLGVYRIFSILPILPLLVVIGDADRKCDPEDLISISSQCSDTEVCDTFSRSCQCRPGYERYNTTYCKPSIVTSTQSTPNYSSLVDNQGNGSLIAGILIPVFLIVFVICGVYVNRKYQLLAWVRHKMSRSNENYDEFMIGQDLDDDDPPLRC
ncbi:hypothetical protein NQ315_009194 [Exocentrus adspersus]|uniref:EGF-like domain-containing protein n=1 Tax=Exocentrus adspersus TaxID=1586481 RepID=A0AAV8WFQ2_9CUCU|nr:hypothetical protein NQ315_009194 [Exocentrus adspersus]